MADRPTALVTGATSGIGLETARGLAREGFHVVLLGRSAARGAAARADIEGSVAGASTDLVLADLGEQSEVRAAAAELLDRLDRLDVLVNNAGLALRRTPKDRTAEGHDPLLAVNHLGPFLLTNLLLPLLERSAPSRIVNVASDAHRIGRVDLEALDHPRRYGLLGFRRYGATKLMNILFTRELARRLDGTDVTANCLHPGVIRTRLGRGASGPLRLGWTLAKSAFGSPRRGASTIVHLATSEEGGSISGAYFSGSRPRAPRGAPGGTEQRLWEISAELVGLARLNAR